VTTHVYDPDETGPSMTLELPVVVVEKLIQIAYREFTPAQHGLDGAFVDELRAQLAEYRNA
jgi:hypothetical protein